MRNISPCFEFAELGRQHVSRSGGNGFAQFADAAQIQAAVAKIVDAFGGIDVLVNNAFDPTAVLSPILDLSVEQLQRNFEVGPIVYLRFMQASYPYLKASRQGRVINFASPAGISGMTGCDPCKLAREAVRAPTRMAAREWGPDRITVNNVLPVADTWGAAAASIPAPANALVRFGEPGDDIAPVVLFLASQDAQFVTGCSLAPDGGYIIDSAR